MGVYSVDKLITETRRIASEYRKATGKTLPVTPEIAINDAISILKLEPASNNDSYDAVFAHAGEELKVQIKGRAIFDNQKKGQRLGQIKPDQEWDAIILVIMNDEFMPQEMYIGRRDVVMHELDGKSASNRKGAMTVAKFKIISDLLWTEQNGIEPDFS